MASKTLERLQVLITADGSGLASGLDEVANKAEKFGKRLGGVGKKLSRNITAPIAALGAGSVKAFADFDKAMTQSLSIMGDVSDTMRRDMSDAAREVGRTTTFAASEAGEAFYFLASAGLDAEQSIAALPQVAAFAQAGMFDLSTATTLAADAQSALGLKSADAQENLANMARVTDVLVEAANSANASVLEFSEALTNKAANAMQSLGVEVEEGVAALAVFADQGIKGAEAGTRLEQVVRGLTEGVRKNEEAWEEAGIAVFDSEGAFRGFGDIIADMEESLAGLSVEQQRAKLAQLGFTSETLAGVLALTGNSEALKELEDRYRAAGGVVQKVADEQLTSFSAQMGLVKDNVIDVAIEIGEVLAPTISKLAEFVGVVADRIRDLNPTVLKWGLVIAGVAAAIGPLLVVVGGLIAMIPAMIAGFTTLAPILAALTGPIGLIVAGIGLAVAAFFKWREEITGFISDALEPLKPIFASIMEVFQAFGGLIMEIAGPILKPLAQVLGVVLIGALQTLVFTLQLLVEALNLTMVPALKGVTIALQFMTEAFSMGRELIGTSINAMIGFVVNMVTRIKELMGAGIRAAFGPAIETIEKVKGAFKGLFDAVVGNSFIPEMIDAISANMDRLGPEMVGKVINATGEASGLFSKMQVNISSSVASVLQMVQRVLAKLSGGGGFLGGITGAIGGFLSGGPVGAVLGFAGGFAEGGTINAGDIGIVGEAGPEIVSGPAQVTPMNDLTFRIDTSSMPPMPRGLSPQEAAIHSWYRQLFSEMVLDGKARGVLG